jgi:ornithine cyclodeaminase/alanine dehydrogenase-like protein (mu-crystallin family)
MRVLMLSQDDVRRLLDPDRLLDALEAGFRAISAGRVDVPPRVAANAPAGALWVMAGYGQDLGLATKLVSVFPGGEARGIPLHQALICLFDPVTGSPLAVMDGDRITAIRTAGGSAVSARHLARKDARVLAIVGAGVQGAAHLEMLSQVRGFAEIRIASRTFEHAASLAETDPRARAVESAEAAVRGADVVALCMQAERTVLRREWLAPGTHVTSVGFAPGGELDRRTVEEARLYVESRASAFQPPPVGCAELVGLPPESAAEMGELLLGKAAGRGSREELTVYKSMGHAIEDVAAARLVFEAAVAVGAGSTFEM